MKLVIFWGLPDLYSFTGEGSGFAGEFSVMGDLRGHGKNFFGWEKWLLGWLDDRQVICVTEKKKKIFKLSAIERKDNDIPTKMIVVPLGDKQAVVVEV